MTDPVTRLNAALEGRGSSLVFLWIGRDGSGDAQMVKDRRDP